MTTVKSHIISRQQTSAKRSIDQNDKAYGYWEVLTAYEAGRKAGIELSDKIYKKAFEDNLDRSFEACRKIYALLKEHGIECHMVSIRPEGITEFDLLFAVEKKKFNSVNFAKTYPLAENQIRGIKSKTLELSISFMPFSQDINEEKLDAGGFLTIYNGKKS